jgi:hypothetical protein
MAVQQITAADVKNWNSLEDIATSFEKRGLKPLPDISDDNRLVLELADGEFIELVQAGTGKSATDYKPGSITRHTNLVATDDYESFTFITRVRDWDAHGRIKYQQFSFEKDQFRRDSGEKNTVLQKLNEIEYGQSAAVMDDLYDTRKIVKEFYEQFESLRTDLVQEVDGIPEDRGDAKQRYVQVLLDRMIFLYFIQEKNLLDYNADYLHNHHERIANEGGDVYADFYDPLFFELLAEGKDDPEFGKLPYLNGGLFSKNPIEEEFEDAKLGESTEATNELFGRILDFFSDWNWNVDERLDIVDPKNLSPAVLGHIFEQTVNQKEMGAYYTPEEITEFMARQTIHPYLLDQLNEAEGTDYESIDDVFSLDAVRAEDGEEEAIADGGVLAHEVDAETIEQDHIETLYFDVLKEIRLLDPAVGSGAFLLAAQEVLMDVYIQCIEYFRAQEENQPWELTNNIKNELDAIRKTSGNETLYAKRNIIISNLYGVDIDEGAVEICKLRLWLSMVADIEDEPNEVEPLPNIDFNIRQGNSLIGFTKPEEIANKKGDATLSNYGGGIGESVREMYNDVIEAVHRYRDADSGNETANARNLAESRIREHSHSLDVKILEQFHNSDIEDICLDDLREYSPFHWVLEFAPVYSEGGFDIVIGNPPWDKVKATRDDYFIRYDPKFISLPTKSKTKRQNELLEDDKIQQGWVEYKQKAEQLGSFYRNQYSKQSSVVSGRTISGDTDVAPLFVERSRELAGKGGYASLILPNIIFTGGSYKNLRRSLLTDAAMDSLFTFENRGIFQGIDSRYTFSIATYKLDGSTDSILSAYRRGDLSVLHSPREDGIETPSRILLEFSPESGMFPKIKSQRHMDILDKITRLPSLEEGWNLDLYRELDQTNDADRFFNEDGNDRYSLYGGKNIFQFSYSPPHAQPVEYFSVPESEPKKSAKARIRGKNLRSLKNSIHSFIDAPQSKSKKSAVNDRLTELRGEELRSEDVLLDCTEYRIGYRDIARPTDERTAIAAVLPKGVITYTNLTTVRPYTIKPNEESLSKIPLHDAYQRKYTDKELFALTGLINSLAFDFLIGEKTDKRIATYGMLESQAPTFSEGDDWFDYIATRSAKLNCYGDQFEEMRKRLGEVDPVVDQEERRQTQAEIDAAAFHAYNLDYEDAEFIVEDKHRVQNPRIMDDKYFNAVLEIYQRINKTNP